MVDLDLLASRKPRIFSKKDAAMSKTQNYMAFPRIKASNIDTEKSGRSSRAQTSRQLDHFEISPPLFRPCFGKWDLNQPPSSSYRAYPST